MNELLLEDILRMIERGDVTDEAFETVALRLFAEQYERNAPYRAFCFGLGKTPRTVRAWRDIPAAPIRAFKTSALTCSDPDTAEAVFMTSGTTNPNERGRHYHPSLAVYDASMRAGFRRFAMKGRDKIRMAVMFPEERLLPHSSLAHYLALALTSFGAAGSGYAMDEDRLDLDALRRLCENAIADGEPLLVSGATFSFVHALDRFAGSGVRFALPEGSLLFDTGGTKGRSREVEPEAFYRDVGDLFGVPRERCVNMYGMTELSSQFYDTAGDDWKEGPPWIRTRAVDPVTGADVPAGEPGVLLHVDLANWNSSAAILTEDIGLLHEDGRRFRLLGRAEGAAARGCSLTAEAFASAAAGSDA
ncbi:long-chain fatty acid--CoA ligase [Paenibacillus sp. TRM 82003]|nr:long-chain fatty acid--CoA ligase [Paenibacillus sp. TRM 82003]